VSNSAKSVPKQLWNILNRFSEKSRQSVDVSLDELYNYFKEMNEVENDNIEIVINLNEDNRYNTNRPTYRNYTFIKNKVKQFKIYWNHKLHSICLNIHW
jgi:Asp-tRNA(Asn)/Glu-tRNA(Gln) amidotransferase C subunit